MVEYISQDQMGLGHISMLRKIMTKKMSGRLHITLGSGETLPIYFRSGGTLGQTTIENLRKTISLPVVKFGWEEMENNDIKGWRSPETGLSTALTNLSISVDRLDVYKNTFQKLPALHMKKTPFHHFNFGDEREYQSLYKLSLSSSSFDIKPYLSNIKFEPIYLKRVRTVLFAFLLGHLTPAPKQVEKPKLTDKASIAARILQRFRGA